MTLFFRELKANRKALIIWSICMILGVLSGMSKYTTYSSGGTASEALKQLPQAMRALFGMSSFNVSVMSVFFAFLFSYIVLAAAIHAALLGSGILAKEERDKTTEFLMVKPISRATILTAKLIAALVNLVILNLVTLLSSYYFVNLYNKGEAINGEITALFVTMLIVQLLFLSLGAFLSALLKNPKASGSLVTAILFGAYLIGKITELAGHLNALKVLSPFQYFSYTAIVRGESLNFVNVLLTLLLSAVLAAGCYYFYRKRDLTI
ncbi:MAG: ABC transporter permease subunit [Sporolactobacillus sp.]